MAIYTTEPASVKEALAGPDAYKWLEAFDNEILNHLHRSTFEFIDRRGAKAGRLVTTKWVMKAKQASDGNISKFKARLVARGFTQKKGIDYFQTYASTARAASWRLLIALATILGWYIAHVDFVAAYLNGILMEVIFAEQPTLLAEFFSRNPDLAKKHNYSPDKAIRIQRPLYGLKQSGYAWQQRVKKEMAALRFFPLQSDPAVYYNPKTGVILASYVDDFLIFSPTEELAKEVVASIGKALEIEDFGEAKWFLGVRIHREGQVTTLAQDVYMDNMVSDLGPAQGHNSRPIHTPIEPSKARAAKPHKGKATIKETFDYASAVSKVAYPVIITRPDAAYTISRWNRYITNPTPEHVEGIARLVKYYRTTRARAVQYSGPAGPANNKLNITAASDSDYAGDLASAKSTTGWIIYAANGPVAWASRLQETVAQSTAEVEYIALNAVTKELAWVRQFLDELGYLIQGPITVKCDNLAAKGWVEEVEMSR